ncbi:unnamed protein product [Brassica rapa]|uniref:Uncharacterized protein n=3 Tax=Brassica TaxID=3705 RepID=A0A3P5XZG4_BRACM|nr:unnamed protein product [Brassica napus]CAG7861924.1 unnamed protein product [Brassica rapa]CDY35147.1 BnaA09g17840D [Brassica napus]VDC60206.1 unnamed protein product [Brassica rapa]
MPVDNNNAFQVAAPSEVDDEWTQHALWGFSKQKVPMPACSGRLQKAENQPFALGRNLPEFRDCFLRHQRKTTPKTSNRKS